MVTTAVPINDSRRASRNLMYPTVTTSGVTAHGSLEGVGGLKANEANHWKADALLISEM